MRDSDFPEYEISHQPTLKDFYTFALLTFKQVYTANNILENREIEDICLRSGGHSGSVVEEKKLIQLLLEINDFAVVITYKEALDSNPFTINHFNNNLTIGIKVIQIFESVDKIPEISKYLTHTQLDIRNLAKSILVKEEKTAEEKLVNIDKISQITE